MIIKGVQKTSLIDYPGNICSVLFVGGCNFRCPYCHNSELVFDSPELPVMFTDEILNFLESRKNFIDGVCISGGEPTVHRGLPGFCGRVKKMGLLVKVDTNGSNPGMLKMLMENKLVDYIAMDVKGPLATYENTAGANVDPDTIRSSIGLIMESGVDHEFRTTVVPGLIDADDMRKIAQLVKGARRFAIQQFSNGSTLDTSFQSVEPYPEDRLEEFREIVKPFVGSCEIRGT